MNGNSTKSLERQHSIRSGEEDFQAFVRAMETGELLERTSWLQVLTQDPSRDPRVLPYLEKLLEDQTPCLVMIPYMFGEVRWLAARARAVERAKLGLGELVRVTVIDPLDTGELARLKQEAGIHGRGGVEGQLETLRRLAEMGKAPLIELELDPGDFV
jgi:hypothetical protein